MKCSKAHKLMSPYIDGEISAAEAGFLETHIRECTSCAAGLETLQQMRGLFRQSERYSAPYGFSTRVVAAAKASEKAGRGGMPYFVGLAEAVAAMAIITAGIVSGNFLFERLLTPMPTALTALSLDVFDPAPPDSPAGVYLALTEAGHEN